MNFSRQPRGDEELKLPPKLYPSNSHATLNYQTWWNPLVRLQLPKFELIRHAARSPLLIGAGGGGMLFNSRLQSVSKLFGLMNNAPGAR